MKKLTHILSLGLSILMLTALSGCGEEEGTTPFSANRTITAADAESIALTVLEFNDFAASFRQVNNGTKDSVKIGNSTYKVVDSASYDCAVSGTVTFTIDSDAGTFTITSNNCNDGIEVVNGYLTLAGSTSGTVSTISFSFNITIDGITNSGSINSTFDSADNSYTFSINMNLTTPEGGLIITTNQPFTGIGLNYASSGQMTITGANNTSLRITALDTDVQIEVDEDGDGVYETNYTTPWANLGN